MSDFAGSLEVQMVQNMVEGKAIEIMYTQQTIITSIKEGCYIVSYPETHLLVQQLLWVGTGIGLQ